MTWHELLFMHWPVEVSQLRSLIPSPLELDTFEGRAWISIVPFRMSGVAPRLCPNLPWLSAFPELNVRTYVTDGQRGGVWFFSLDATNPIAVRVARRQFYLSYMDARITMQRGDDGIRYISHRTHRGEPAAELDVTYWPLGETRTTTPGTLEHWLTARYCMYMANRRGQLFIGEIDHAPWELQSAQVTVHRNTMTHWLNLDTDTPPPHVQYAHLTQVRAWGKRTLEIAT
jgi:uncharacterized protein YqjF (DUF2071 family)